MRAFSARGFAIIAACGLTAGLAASGARADLVYQPTNPNFGGNPLNSSQLLESAGIQNQYQPSFGGGVGDLDGLTPAEEFAATLQRRLLFAVSDQIVNTIFDPDGADSGIFQVEGTTIQYEVVGNNVRLIINDGQSQTEITVPRGF